MTMILFNTPYNLDSLECMTYIIYEEWCGCVHHQVSQVWRSNHFRSYPQTKNHFLIKNRRSVISTSNIAYQNRKIFIITKRMKSSETHSKKRKQKNPIPFQNPFRSNFAAINAWDCGFDDVDESSILSVENSQASFVLIEDNGGKMEEMLVL